MFLLYESNELFPGNKLLKPGTFVELAQNLEKISIHAYTIDIGRES